MTTEGTEEIFYPAIIFFWFTRECTFLLRNQRYRWPHILQKIRWGQSWSFRSYYKLILSELKINPPKALRTYLVETGYISTLKQLSSTFFFSQAKCKWKTDITDFVSRQNEMDEFNVSTGKRKGAVPKRATQCSLLIYVNIFLLK